MGKGFYRLLSTQAAAEQQTDVLARGRAKWSRFKHVLSGGLDRLMPSAATAGTNSMGALDWLLLAVVHFAVLS